MFGKILTVIVKCIFFFLPISRQLWPSGWTVASFVLDAAATLWTQTSDGLQVLPILSTVSAGRIAALDVHRVDITADAASQSVLMRCEDTRCHAACGGSLDFYFARR